MKKQNICWRPTCGESTWQISSHSIHFGHQMAPLSVQCHDVKIFHHNFWRFWTLYSVHQNKLHHWNPETKMQKIHVFLIKNWPFWPHLTSKWPVIEVKLQNKRNHWFLRLKLPRKHVSHNIHTQLPNTSWPFVTSAWPCPVLTISMKRIQGLPLYFGSIYGYFGHAAIDIPESVAENPKTMLLTFDLTLTLHVTFYRKI